MKKFYYTTSGEDTTQLKNLNGIGGFTQKIEGDKFEYLSDSLINGLQYKDQLTIFGDDAFNMLNSYISINSIISAPPISPTENTWYIVSSNTEELYDNIVQITLSGSLAGGSVDDWVIAENGATGRISAISTNDYTIRYNGTDFLEAGGSNNIYLGQVYGTGSTATITDEDATAAIKTSMATKLNHLVYYKSTDTAKFKFLLPFEGIRLTYSGNNYEFSGKNTRDDRWKQIIGSVGTFTIINISTDIDDLGGSGSIRSAAITTNAQGIGAPMNLNASGQWVTCNANVTGTVMPCRALALSTATGGASGDLLISGFYRDDTTFSGWAIGSDVYVDDVAGTLVNSDSGFATGDIIQKVGYMFDTGLLSFNVSGGSLITKA